MPIETSKFGTKTKYKGQRYKGQKPQGGSFKLLIVLFILIPIIFYFTSGSSRIAFVNFHMGKLYEKIGKYETAKKMYESAHLASKGKYHVAQLKYSEMLVNLKQFDAADIELNKMVAMSLPDNNIMAEVYYQKALISENSNSWEDAFVNFIRCTQLNPDHYFAYIGLGRVSRIKGSHSESIKYLESAVSKRKLRAPEAHYELGLTYLALGQNARALDEFDYALSQMPSKEIKQLAQQKKNETIGGGG